MDFFLVWILGNIEVTLNFDGLMNFFIGQKRLRKAELDDIS